MEDRAAEVGVQQQRWGDAYVAVLCGALALVAAGLTVGLPEQTAHDRPLPWWVLAVGFAVGELVVVYVQVRRETVSLSFAEIPLVLGLAFAAPSSVVLASLFGSAVVLVLHRRLRGLKLIFNLALFAAEPAIALTVYLALAGGAEPASVRAGLATLAAVIVCDFANSIAVVVVISASTGRIDREPLLEAASTGLMATVANCSLALLTVVLLVRQPAALVLLLVVLAALVAVYRAYASLGRGHARLQLLYQFTRGVAGQVDSRSVSARVLEEARDVLTSGLADLVLLRPDGTVERHLRLSDHDDLVVDVDDPDGWWRDATTGRPVLHPRGGTRAGYASGEPLDDALAVPLQAGGAVVGVLAVAQRPGFLPTYGDDDLRLFQSLADHAAGALRNVGLVDQLRQEAAEREHQALHDSLTGLANRQRFLDRLGEELALGPAVAVLLLDLVDFGQVNDALGYDTGDRLLLEVGGRLVEHLGSEQVARLGNDEFAVLLLGADRPAELHGQVVDLLRLLEVAFPVDAFSLDVHATAGLAHSPEHGTEPSQLLRRADAALSAAKADGRELAVYDLDADRRSSRRLQLVADLRVALASRQLTVHYQPKTHPRTGVALGAEALVRWTHPALGPISPDEFVPLAEQAGLVGALTTHVLDSALEQCAAWRAAGRQLSISVNLSTRSLTDAELPRRVQAALDRAGVPAAALTLEITESAVMTDLQRSLDVLNALRQLGLHLSVDDFGTGHSALAYLKQLPVQEVKIDKSFVQGLASDPADAAIVAAAVSLGHALGLTVVAEGVEDEDTRAHLAALGVDSLQGFLLSRPLPADRFRDWLATAPRALVPAQR